MWDIWDMSGQWSAVVTMRLAPTCHYMSSSSPLSLNVATTESYKWSPGTLLALLVPWPHLPLLTPGSSSAHCQHFRPGWAAISNTWDKTDIQLILASETCRQANWKLLSSWDCFYVYPLHLGIFRLFYYRVNCFYPHDIINLREIMVQ